MASSTPISRSITPSESSSSIGTLERSIETPYRFLQPAPRDPNVRYDRGKTYRRNFVERTKRQRSGWYWRHGTEWDEEISEGLTEFCWVCDHCVLFHPIRATGSNHIKKHLGKAHNLREGQEDIDTYTIQESFANTSDPSFSTTTPSNYSLSDRTELKKRYCRKTLLNWITHNHISFREVESEEFQLFCNSLNEKYQLYIPSSHGQISIWVQDEYQHQKNDIRAKISHAKSQIHLSFDLWTSPFRNFAVLAVVGHFLSGENKNTALLLGLRRIRGSHSGENMAKEVLQVLREYEIGNQFGYFILDNASSNDNAVKAILQEFNISSEYEERRLRCFGHIINLVAQAFLFGQAIPAFESDDYEEMEEAYEEYQKAGPVGLIHFIAVFIRSSSQRREDFSRCQLGDEELVPKADNRTRWNSTFYMLKRALLLRKPIDLFCLQYIESKDLNTGFKLDGLAWSRLQAVCDILEKFEVVTKTLEGSAKEGHHGALWECLPAMELILKQLEDLKSKYPLLDNHSVASNASQSRRKSGVPLTPSETLTDQFLAIAINNAWVKLDKYYNLTDRSVVYIAAVILNPAHKWKYFEKHWATRVDWLATAKEKFQILWDQYKKDHPIPVVVPAAADPLHHRVQPLQVHMESLYSDEDDSTDGRDDLERYLDSGRRKPPPGELYFNPIAWWSEKRTEFPILAQLALNLLSIPAMAAEDERVFSSTGKLITADRNQLDEDTIEAVECLRHWYRASKPPKRKRQTSLNTI
jgi:hAT family C-terminal dimerisation region